MDSLVNEESVQRVATDLGVNVEGVSTQISMEVEFRMRKIVEIACKFMRRGRREKLTMDDLNYALESQGERHILGFARGDRIKWERKNESTVLLVHEEDVNISKLLEESTKAFLPSKVPLEVSYAIHWLAIDGIQPTIDENPKIFQNESKLVPDPATEKSQIFKTLDLDLTESNGKIAKHSLSKELMSYFDKVISAVLDYAGGNRQAAEAVFVSLAKDRGLQALMPYLSKFIFDQVNKSLSNLNVLIATMRLTKCILVNPNLEEENYLQQLMPPILTCIVHSKLCASPFLDHWALRDFAASLIPIIFAAYGDLYTDMKPRVAKTLRNALDGDKRKALTTQYGAIIGICSMGPLTVQSVLLPFMKQLFNRFLKITLRPVNETLSASAHSSHKYRIFTIKRLEAQNCIGALHMALGQYIRAQGVPALRQALLLEEHLPMLMDAANAAGEATIAWTPSNDRSSYMNLFI